MKGNCLECKAEFRGRTDKKFCSDPCRSAFHNRRNQKPNGVVRLVNRQLGRNYRILSRWAATAPATVLRKDILLREGFHFQVYTQRETDGTSTVYWVYNRAYRSCGPDRVTLLPESVTDKKLRDLFPVMRAEFQGCNHDVLPADLPNKQAVLHNR